MPVRNYVLPFDVARCRGVPDEYNCKVCLRNQPGHPTRQLCVEPAIHDGKCENLELYEENEKCQISQRRKK